MIDQLFPSQQGLVEAGFLDSTDHWVISAPTGSGKTRMGEWAIHKALDNGRRAAYIAPLKAIVEERLLDWGEKFNEVGVGAYTGSTNLRASPGQERLLLFTPEKLAAYLSSWKNHLGWISDLDVLLIDEFHLIGDSSRGPALETLIGRIERSNPFIRIIGLSATIANTSDLSEWLKARTYQTDWRPVPITHSLRRFKRATDKVELLVEELQKTLTEGGRTLVFVNSRRRAESLAKTITERGFLVAYTHAGQTGSDQKSTHQAFRKGELEVLIATSTLEMGVNLPARKVIIYDNYAFEGDSFKPISRQRYLQFAGRAGRAGLDPCGEAVLFAPQWDGDAERYMTAQPDPVRSALFSTSHLQREILYEVSSRLSVSELHLETNFAKRTLWRHQGGSKSIATHVQSLIAAGLIRTADKGEKQYLSATALGRIATQMSVSPTTVMLLRKTFESIEHPTEFDILLIICLCEEVTPKLGFNFEEIDEMGDLILETPSRYLDMTLIEALKYLTGMNEKRLLSAIKCAALLTAHTQMTPIEVLSDRFDCYPTDLYSLKRNSVWILEAGKRVFAVLNLKQHNLEYQDVDFVPPIELSEHEVITESLNLMVAYGIPKGAIDLVRIEGIGPKRAQRLCDEGIFTAQEVALMSAESLAELLHLSPNVAEKVLLSASTIPCKDRKKEIIGTSSDSTQSLLPQQLNKRFQVDPYRLRRALELTVDHCSAEKVHVSGGAEPHIVSVLESPDRKCIYVCDCADYAKGHDQCKHILRARLALHDDSDLQQLLKHFNQSSHSAPLRYSLTELWMKVGKAYDAFNSRKVDYTGQAFLETTKPVRRKIR
jgi:helicase